MGTKPATDYFRPAEYRPGQQEAIEQIDAAFAEGYERVLLEAPTGSGKSQIARAFAFQARRTHVLTIQKILQNQYQRDHSDMCIVQGRGAYRCRDADDGSSCATGPCRRRRQENPNCPYRQAIASAKRARVVVHNFDGFYYQSRFGGHYSRRELLVVDEAHNLESKALDFMSFSLSTREVPNLPEYEDEDDYLEFLVGYRDRLDRRVRALDRNDELSAEELRELDDATRLLAKLVLYFEERAQNEYVVNFERLGKTGHSRATFKPIYVTDFVRDAILGYGERALLMSATVLDPDVYCRAIGLDPEETAFVRLPSHFPVANRLILKRYAGSMSFRRIGDTLPAMLDRLRELLAAHPERGIVQTHTDRIAEFVKEHLRDPRLTFRSDYESVDDMLEVHAGKPGSWIVASGLREGLDLVGDLSRVQVICKIPWPPLGDKRIRRRMELDADWYGYQTVLGFVQAIGRSVRSVEDRAVTYVLDADFDGFLRRNGQFVPEHVRRAIAAQDADGTYYVQDEYGDWEPLDGEAAS